MEESVPSYNDMVELARRITIGETRALFIIAYLTAGRINEILPKRFIFRQSLNKDTKVLEKWKEEINYPGLKGSDIEFVKHKGIDIMLVTMLNEKNRKSNVKKIPIPIDKEKELVMMLMSWIESNPGVMFPFSTVAAWYRMKRLGFNPHYLRHIRTTHLITRYDLPDHLIVKYLGWTDSRPLIRYAHLRWSDIADKMI